MSPLRRLLAALWLAGCGSAAPLRVRVLPNGASWKAEPKELSAGSWSALREEVERNSGLDGLGKEWWLADTDGFRVASWEAVLKLSEAQRTFTVVPEGRPFQWGARRVGERFPVKLQGREGVELETVASSPGIFLLHNLFTEQEAMYLIERTTKLTGEWALRESGIGFRTNGEREVDRTRTSSSAFDSDSPGAKEMIKRCFEALRMNFSRPMSDGLQILRYEIGQAYIAHTDWFDPEDREDTHNFDTTTPDGSNRYATVFLYLWPPPTGGLTVFPKAKIEEDLKSSAFVSIGDDQVLLEDQVRQAKQHYNGSDWEVELTRQCYSHLAVKPVRLGAALFYHQHPMTGELLEEAEHGACPSLTGTKWGANLWIWNRDRHLTSPGDDDDEEDGDDDDDGPPPVSAKFQNAHKATLALEYSMDDGATWAAYQTLGPGTTITAMTDEGTVWRFLQGGKVVREWTVPADVETARFASRPQSDDEL